MATKKKLPSPSRQNNSAPKRARDRVVALPSIAERRQAALGRADEVSSHLRLLRERLEGAAPGSPDEEQTCAMIERLWCAKLDKAPHAAARMLLLEFLWQGPWVAHQDLTLRAIARSCTGLELSAVEQSALANAGPEWDGMKQLLATQGARSWGDGNWGDAVWGSATLQPETTRELGQLKYGDAADYVLYRFKESFPEFASKLDQGDVERGIELMARNTASATNTKNPAKWQFLASLMAKLSPELKVKPQSLEAEWRKWRAART